MAVSDEGLSLLGDRFAVLLPHLNQRQRRLAVAVEARLIGHGGVRVAAQVAGMSGTTVRRGVFELEGGEGPSGLAGGGAGDGVQAHRGRPGTAGER